MKPLFFLLSFLFAACFLLESQAAPSDTVWTPLFNGSDKKDWDVKITGHPLNWDSLNTFRVAPCVNDTGNCLELNYANYTNWNGNPWGRAAYKLRPFSYYYLRAKYQLFGTQTPGTPNSSMEQDAILLHSQTMASLGLNQDWPNAIEDQLVGPDNKLNAVGTSNLCADGMAFQNNPTGALNHTHCTNVIANPMTLAPTWTTVSALVLGDSLIDFFAGNKSVITFYKPVQWNDGLIHGNTITIANNTPVTGGYVGIQGEGASIRFQTLEVANLVGCKSNPASPNYRNYFVKDSAEACNAVTVAENRAPFSNGISFNPTRRRLFLNIPEAFTVKVSDLSGKTVWSRQGRGSRDYDLKSIGPRGIYFLSVFRSGSVFNQKLLLGP